MSKASVRRSCNASLLLMAAVLLWVLSGTQAQVPSPDERADGGLHYTREEDAGMHDI
jgi:hypothetical protein